MASVTELAPASRIVALGSPLSRVTVSWKLVTTLPNWSTTVTVRPCSSPAVVVLLVEVALLRVQPPAPRPVLVRSTAGPPVALMVFVVPPRSAATGDGQLLAQADATAVEQVDFGTHDGAVLQLPGDTTVIWMSEDKAVPQ